MTWYHPSLAQKTIGALDTEMDRLREENTRLRAALATIAGDGKNCTDHCRRQANKALYQQSTAEK